MNRYHFLFIHSSTDGRLGCFHILAIVNSAVINTGVYMCFWIRDLLFFRWIPRGGIPGPNGISIFSFLRHLHITFHNGWTSLHSHQQCRTVPLSLHPRYYQFLKNDDRLYKWKSIPKFRKWTYSKAVLVICLIEKIH